MPETSLLGQTLLKRKMRENITQDSQHFNSNEFLLAH